MDLAQLLQKHKESHRQRKQKFSHLMSPGWDKFSMRKSELGWPSPSVKDGPATVVQSDLASAIYQSVSNTRAHNADAGRPLPKALLQVDHEYLKPFEVRLHEYLKPSVVRLRRTIRSGTYTNVCTCAYMLNYARQRTTPTRIDTN